MNNSLLDGVKTVHFIGIGGSGMFPLVQILHEKGFEITGSDNNESDTLKMVRNLGIKVNMNQRAENIKNVDLIIYTSAVFDDNPELVAAKKSKIKTIERNDLLGYLTALHSDCVCVCGTHGKTTTTSMLTQILLDSNMDPSAVIGGKLKSINSYARLGNSQIMVCEACEYANHFLKLAPDISIVLNIDNDHMEYFKTVKNLKNSFGKFLNQTTKTVIYNGDDENVSDVVSAVDKKRISFGFLPTNDFYPTNISRISGTKTKFSICRRGKIVAKDVEIFVPGRHNILNAVAAAAAAFELKAPVEGILKGLFNFRGVGRRFEFIGEKNGITVVDDYAHHPTEIYATLKAAKECGFKKVWAVHQPFTYSRTKMLIDEFAKALGVADRVVLTEIMGSREKNTFGVYAKDLAEKIDGCVWFKTQSEAAQYVLENADSGDLVITLGCGDIYKCAKIMVFGKY